MRIGTTLTVAAAALLTSAAAMADDLALKPNNGVPADGQAAVGVGLICNTPEQAARFVTLRSQGTEPEKAMATVNAEAKQPLACGVAAVAFVPDQTTGTKTLDGKLVRIVRINVVAGFNGHDWQPVANMVQYAVIEAKGETI
jgi:hypothetical protein